MNGLPVGVGGNNDYIALIEKQTGLKVGENLNYGYCPLRPRAAAGPIACLAKVKDSASLEDLGMRASYGDIIATGSTTPPRS